MNKDYHLYKQKHPLHPILYANCLNHL